MFTLLQVGNGTGLPPITVDSLLGDMTVLIVLSAVIVGIAWRTLGKYWDKWRDGEAITFDRVFLGTAIAAFVGAITPALAVFPQASAMFASTFGNYGLALSWIITVGWAYGLNESINYTYRRMEHRAEAKVVKDLKEQFPEINKLMEQKVKELAEEIRNTPTSTELKSDTEGKHEA